MKRIALVAFLASLGAILLVQPARARQELQAWATPKPPNQARAAAFRPGEVLVRFKDGVSERDASRRLQEVGAREARPARFTTHLRVILDKGAEVEATVRRLAAMPEVDYAEPNQIRTKSQGSTFSPNDRFYRAQWNLKLIGAPRTWAIQKGKADIGVAVLDTGVAFEDYGPFRKAPDWGGQRFLPGYDAVERDGHPNDDEFHGTHVSSTVAEATNNNEGVAGLAFDCSIMPVKVLDDQGRGSDFDVAEGIDYVTNFRQGGVNPVKVINMSLGGPGSSETLRRAVDRASASGILIVAAAGNENVSDIDFPAGFENVIAVGAVDQGKRRAPYSNYGTALDVVAPGGDGGRDDDNDGNEDFVYQQMPFPPAVFAGQFDDFCYCGLEGTSMASPHVAALAALLFSQGIGDARAVRAVIEQTAEDLGQTGRDDQFGHGLIRPEKALSGLGLAK